MKEITCAKIASAVEKLCVKAGSVAPGGYGNADRVCCRLRSFT